MRNLLIFDYDKTLARPVSVPSDQMLKEFSRILKGNYIAIMSGGRTKEQIVELFIENIPIADKSLLEHIFICPSYGNRIYQWVNGSLNLIYKAQKMSEEDNSYIYLALKDIPWSKYGVEYVKDKQIADRGTYIAIDCFGKDAPKSVREQWDPDKVKRQPIKHFLDNKFKDRFDVFVSGRTTIDIVAKGNNKADNTKKLAKMLNIPLKNVVFTGDEFQTYGNDYPLLSLEDIKINIVQNPKETLAVIQRM